MSGKYAKALLDFPIPIGLLSCEYKICQGSSWLYYSDMVIIMWVQKYAKVPLDFTILIGLLSCECKVCLGSSWLPYSDRVITMRVQYIPRLFLTSLFWYCFITWVKNYAMVLLDFPILIGLLSCECKVCQGSSWLPYFDRVINMWVQNIFLTFRIGFLSCEYKKFKCFARIYIFPNSISSKEKNLN